jgi:hypothetical protein
MCVLKRYSEMEIETVKYRYRTGFLINLDERTSKESLYLYPHKKSLNIVPGDVLQVGPHPLHELPNVLGANLKKKLGLKIPVFKGTVA